ncbi:hypothetical protein MMC17_005685 [Xylographa soralifera]|nr:hypothetical protein [Xylographa soralifera]
MPSGTGLYEDSDDESLSNELSPTNGYFNQRPNHPQDVLVPDPSQNTAEANKAREAEQEQGTNSAPENTIAPRRPSHFSTPSISTRRRLDPDFEEDFHTEHSPLIPSGPPTYSAATAGHSYPSPRSNSYASAGARNNRQYNTMDGREVFLYERPPEDLGGAPLIGLTDREEPAWKKRGRGYFPKDLRSVIKVLIGLAALAVAIGIIANMVTVSGHHNDEATNPSRPTPGFEESPGTAPASCPGGIYKNSASLSFSSLPEFTFIEFTKGMDWDDIKDYRQITTSGELHIRASNEHLEGEVRIELTMHYSDHIIMSKVQFETSPASLQIFSPSVLPGGSRISAHPCMYMVATMWIRPGIRLDTLEIQSQSMKIIFHEGLSLNTDKIHARAVAGSIEFPAGNSPRVDVNPREINIGTSSGSVSGTFPIYDLLKISTQSGSIKINVEPNDALASKPVPAVLDLKTVSGTIHVDTPMLLLEDGNLLVSSVPVRDYQTDISSSSGSLHAGIILGSKLNMQTSSGSITAVLSPYGSLADDSHLTVSDGSGSVDTTILSSISSPGKPMRNFYSKYKSSTGSLRLHYPKEWEGTVEGETLSGSIKTDWPGMRIIKNGDRYGHYYNKKFKGVVGHGDGLLQFECISGSVGLFGGTGQTSRARLGGDGPAVEKPIALPVGIPGSVGSPPQQWPGFDNNWPDVDEDEEWSGFDDDWLEVMNNL